MFFYLNGKFSKQAAMEEKYVETEIKRNMAKGWRQKHQMLPNHG